MREEWKGFKEGVWTKEINVSDFIKTNYKGYDGDESFLKGTTEKTDRVWGKCSDLLKEELKKHVLDIDVDHMSGINAFKPGYISKDDDVIVGLQTDAPLKRIVNPYGGIRMVYQELDAYGYKLNPEVDKYFNEYRKTHNQGVFDAYTPEIRKARHVGLLTGLPDAYGRGRIIGDYRRVALYGIDYLMEQKKDEWDNKLLGPMTNDLIQLREEVSMQYRALDEIKKMAKGYGFDISRPAKNAKEAVQWTYFGYLASVKENNGAAMSLGRVDAFFDIYFERDLNDGTITEKEIQEIIDQFVIKLRLVRHLRTPEYDELFSGDPTWVTASIGGVTNEGKSMVTKTSYRILHTLTNLDTAPEPNMTVLWAQDLPENFKKYCAKMSIETDAIQYENDDVMRPVYGDDYAIACCVSAMREGKDMQFFGARCNLAKALLYAINGGVDEVKGDLVVEGFPKMTDEVLDYDKVKDAYFKMIEKVAEVYSNAMNIIHYMHDKYAYEAGQMALHDTNVNRLMAYGVAGLSVATDSLSAIKYAKVKPIRNEDGIAIDFEVEGDYPKYGNDDDRVDNIAKEILEKMYKELSKHKCYRNATPTLSVLTITSNVVYGSKTGSTPDGRKAGEPFAPGANPMHGRDSSGAIASLNSVAKLNYADCCRDGISNTFSIVPSSLGHSKDEQIDNLVSLLDGYFVQGAHHLNVNVLQREMLIDAMNNPDKYPLLTIRVSGYAVRFNRLTRKQQEEVISRTFHEKM
ncbi:MAG TPA: formate C-acetyltransferase [Candidatus Onthousia excrementipullorum]|uniref:Formate acetyltransferase n=1 Tax=Candidatus Onthousia excrementipullorum TaxID=2840884 RepID=A0A9D1DT62_9FIRM|nr:formate C-acetyltransferase [Candidatus Onthousia excrementipullorum]